MKVLVIDDNEIDFAVLKRYLSRVDASVDYHHTADPREAVRDIENISPDLIVLDINMPFIDGFEVLEQIRLHKITTPVVMMSTSDLENDQAQAQKLGADGYLSKPMSIDVCPTFYSDFYTDWIAPYSG